MGQKRRIRSRSVSYLLCVAGSRPPKSEIKPTPAVGLTQTAFSTKATHVAKAMQAIVASQDLASSLTRPNENKISDGFRALHHNAERHGLTFPGCIIQLDG